MSEPTPFHRRARLPVAVTVLAAAGVAAVLGAVVTRHGVGYRSDSAVYLGTADNLLHGRGLTSPVTLPFTDTFPPRTAVGYDGALPITALPPLYSVAVAAVGAVGFSITAAARLVGIGCLAAATALVAWMTYRLTGALVVAFAAAILFVGGGALTQSGVFPGSWVLLSSMALSEALFLLIVLLGLLALARLVQIGGTAPLVITGTLGGAAILCRYLGVALVATAVLVVFIRRGWDLRTRVRCCVVLATLGVLPVLVWMLLLRVLVGHGKAIPARRHHISVSFFTDGVRNVAHWFVPTSVPDAVAYLVLALIVAGVVTLLVNETRHGRSMWSRSSEEEGGDALLVTLAVFIVVYLGAVLVSHVLLADNVVFDVRFLAIVRPMVYVVVVSVVYRFLGRYGTKLAMGVVSVACAAIVASFASPLADLARHGVAAPPARSETLAAVRRLSPHALIFSNEVDQLWLHDRRDAVLMPVRFVAESQTFNPRAGADVREVAELLRRPNSYLVVFRQLPLTFMPTASIRRLTPLEVVADYADGTIFRRARS